jgi:hypothetical protein
MITCIVLSFKALVNLSNFEKQREESNTEVWNLDNDIRRELVELEKFVSNQIDSLRG